MIRLSVFSFVITASFAFLPVALADEGVERINVIGSHIKRTDVESLSPVLVIDREQIEMSGRNSVSDLLRDLTTSNDTQRETALNSFSSFTGVSLRGFSGSAILTLLNGRRIAPIGGGSSVNMNIIPLSVIERIEILKDGASALYGSDAVGGVINIVTKSFYTGAQVNVQGTLTQRKEGNSLESFLSYFDFMDWDRESDFAGKGDSLTIDASYGTSHDDINYLLGAQLRLSTAMYLRDRSFSLAEIKDYSPAGSPGSWNDGSGWKPAPDCETPLGETGYCGFDYSSYMQSLPDLFQGSLFLQIDTDIDDMSFSSTSLYNYIRAHSLIAPAPDSFTKPVLPGEKDWSIPAETAKNWGLPASGPIEVIYRLVDEKGTGPREGFTNAHYFQLQNTLMKPLRGSLELEGSLNISGTYYDKEGKGYANKKILKELAIQNPSKFNPFATKDKKSDISSATYEPTEDTYSGLVSFEPKLSGEVGEIFHQPFWFALGGFTALETYSQEVDEVTGNKEQWGGGVLATGGGFRYYTSLYGELSGIVAKSLELQLAARTDYYHYDDPDIDIGLTEQEFRVPFTEDTAFPIPFSPRVAFSFQPFDQIKFRSSWGLGFKAPTLDSVYRALVKSYDGGIDAVRCPEEGRDENKNKPECQRTQFRTESSGSKGLKPELSESFNLGLVFEPVPEFAMSLDFFRIKQRDVIVDGPPLNDIFLYEAKNGNEKLKKDLGITVVRDAKGVVEAVQVAAANLSNYKFVGYELELSALFPLTAAWDLNIDNSWAELLYVEKQVFKDSDIEVPVPYYDWIMDAFGIENKQANRGTSLPEPAYPRWRNKTSFNFMNKKWDYSLGLVVHYISTQLHKQVKVSSEEEKKGNGIGDYWQVDVNGSFTLSKNSSLVVGVKNILDIKRPVHNSPISFSGLYLNANLYSIRGRTLNMRWMYNF